VALPVRLWFVADYADVFEVRGARRARRGELAEPELSARAIELGYRGLDGVGRATRFEFEPEPELVEARSAHWLAELEPGARAQISVRITCLVAPGPDAPGSGPLCRARQGRPPGAISPSRSRRRATR
jgi:hypothetical protein